MDIGQWTKVAYVGIGQYSALVLGMGNKCGDRDVQYGGNCSDTVEARGWAIVV